MSIETKDLVKIYRKRRVVDVVNINVERGEVVGLLGPNGAGKTTTFYMVVGLIHPKKGASVLAILHRNHQYSENLQWKKIFQLYGN